MKFKKSLILFLFICLLTVTSFAAVNAADASTAKNIIFMIPDGMSMDIVTAARILKMGLMVNLWLWKNSIMLVISGHIQLILLLLILLLPVLLWQLEKNIIIAK